MQHLTDRQRELRINVVVPNKPLQGIDGLRGVGMPRLDFSGMPERAPMVGATGSPVVKGEGMAFVMIATGATSRSRVRTLSVPPLLALAGVGSLALLISGGALGYWLAEPPPRHVPSTTVAAVPEPLALPFTLEQLGAMSARLFRLESEAAQLSRRIDTFHDELPASSRRPVSRGKTLAGEPSGSSGGPLLPEGSEGFRAGAIDAQLGQIEQRIASVASAVADRTIALMRVPTRLPILGAELTSTFGHRVDPFVHARAFHAGLDFAARVGTPITSAAGGIVAFAGFRHDYGWVVEIDHGDGLATRYAHAAGLDVRVGDVVFPGERIATVGSTGRSTGPHLHFEVLRAGDQVDPKAYLVGM